MGSDPQPDVRQSSIRANSVETDHGVEEKSGLDRKYPIALALYLVLGLAVWFSLGDAKIFVEGRQVELRLVPLAILGLFAFRTYIARQADRIRRQDQSRQASGK
jgi:hypothetical protein